MSSISAHVWQIIAGLVAAVVALVAGVFVLPKIWGWITRHRWWFAGLAVLAVAVVFLFVLPGKFPVESFRPSVLPSFLLRAYWAWMLLFVLLAGGSIVSLAGAIQRRRNGAGAAAAAAGEAANERANIAAFPDLNGAWEEIRVRMDHAGIDLGRQRFGLILAPDEDWAEALIQSAGLQVFVRAPERPAPIHAYATSDGVLLSCAGASAFGAPDDDQASARLEALVGALLALQPDCPVVRGLALLLPIEWASRPDSIRQAAAFRADLQTIQGVLKVRCPVFALFPGMETVPGFVEFMRRLAAQGGPRMLEQRVGFAVPASLEFGGDLVQRGLTWMSGWFDRWILSLLAADPLNARGNAELVLLGHEVRRYRKRLRSILESALSTHREADPVLFRGCYFVATGSGRDEKAFSAGLLRGPRSRIPADHVATTWDAEAARDDRRYTRIALAVGLAGGLPSLWAWLFIAGRTPWGWLGLALGIIAWAAVLLRLRNA